MGSNGDGPVGELVEVEVVPITYVTACHVTVAGGLVHFTGWQETEGEKRIVVRTVISEEACRQMVAQINVKLPRQN